MARREPGARDDEPGDALGQRDGDAGRHDRPLAGLEREALDAAQVEARVARPRARRGLRARVQQLDLEVRGREGGHEADASGPLTLRPPEPARSRRFAYSV